MATSPQAASELLRAEILANAQRERDEILRAARERAEARFAQAEADAERTRRERVDQARAEAARRQDLILATVPVEVGRLRAARVEALLQSIRDEVHRRLRARAGFDYRETLVRLAAEAVGRMAGDEFGVRLSAEDFARLSPGLTEAITRRVGRPSLRLTLAHDPTITEGGLIVQDTAGRQLWDNRLAPRLERLWPELRRQMAAQTALVAASEFTRSEA